MFAVELEGLGDGAREAEFEGEDAASFRSRGGGGGGIAWMSAVELIPEVEGP